MKKLDSLLLDMK